MTTKDKVRSTEEALKLALEALEVASSYVDGYYVPKGKTMLPEVENAITALRTAIAECEARANEQAEKQEPLTDEQIKRSKPVCADFVSFRAGVRYAEARHKEKQP